MREGSDMTAKVGAKDAILSYGLNGDTLHAGRAA
jgi:hypothetical protein